MLERDAAGRARIRSSVDLPIPFGPTIPILLAGGTVNEKPSRTSTSPYDLLMLRATSTPLACGIG
jgi:hypothetical protein